ncbi:helix-turn-helix domain-containing protein [Leucobacter insecticola]|uniref:Helix-turn-helix domain-containing protein n=1 Tax=Leucobacter insecticola TaxID=2714934 RepID=A0A6G8FLI4_9MICO|nr:XRE family transcriptional regulator [Leucobacter insecticola]QIM17143.1 helix-turn-helix domain-containing protein [Leucobacter insecticola]
MIRIQVLRGGGAMEAADEAELGALLREFRDRSNLTLEALAELSGVSVRTIGDIERGVRRAPHRYTLNSLAAALQLPPHDAQMLFSLVRRERAKVAPKPPKPPKLPNVLGPFPLPRMIPDFTGREAELQRAIELLVSQPSPIVTVTGPVGYGTTTFAIALARAAEEDFESTVFLSMVSPEKNSPISPEEAARSIVRAIDPSAKPTPDTEVIAQYQRALIGRRILLVCDDVDGETQVRPLLPTHGESAMILTSRLPLAGLDGVSRLPLGPLEIEDSIRLLESIIPEGQRTAADTAELARFCEGVPLGLRISGNQVASHPGFTVGSVLRNLASDTDRGLGAFSAGIVACWRRSSSRMSVFALSNSWCFAASA